MVCFPYIAKKLTLMKIGMGNRFRDLPGYYNLIVGHGVLAVMVFLFIAPAAVFIARFYGKHPGRAMHLHIYLQIMTLALTTVIFVLGFMAVGPSRSLTNPHHGIGLAIYVIILVQAIGGGWLYRREKGKRRVKLPVKLVLHQWLGRGVVMLGIIQVALGLTLYGSPKWTFVLYSLWVFFLLLLYFILSYRAMPNLDGTFDNRGRPLSSHGGTGTVISEKKSKKGWLGPLAAGAGLAALISRRRRQSRSRSRSQSRSRVEVIPSRRGSRRDSESFIEEEKFETKKREGGIMSKVLKGAAVVGAGALAKNWWDRRQEKKHGDEYTSVATDTPSKKRPRRHDSISEDSISSVTRTDHVHRMEGGRRPGGILPGPGDPVAAAAAISAAEPRPLRTPQRRHSFDSASYSYDSTLSPSRRPQSSHKARNGLLAGVGLGWAAKRWRDRRKSKEQDRQDRIDEDLRIEEERIARLGKKPAKYTGDGFPSGRKQHNRRGSQIHSSDYSSIEDERHHIRPEAIPPIPAALGGAALASGGRSRSHHDLPPVVAAPPPQQSFFPQPESGSEIYFSSGGNQHRRRSSARRREGEDAAAVAAATAAGLAAEQAATRRRSRSREQSAVVSPPVSVKVKMHGDKDRNVTLRRLTEQEAAAEREARRSSRRRRADSVSSLSASETAASNRRYRRDRRAADESAAERRADEIVAEKRAEAGIPPPATTPLSPPNPAFAGGRKPKDSAYYSGRPDAGGSVGSPESHGTWSALSPGSGSEAADRRRRRRLERNQRPSGTVDFT
jgi:hypothetical protein